MHKIQDRGADNAPGGLERAADTWLKDVFIPAALKACAKKKLPTGA